MKTSKIVSKIYRDFSRTYPAATPFVNSGELWQFCIDTISDPRYMTFIAYVNDLEVPPVKALLLIYDRTVHPAPDFVFSDQQKKDMGSLMGFVFKYVLGYREQKERCTVNFLGVKTATRFLNCTSFETFES